MRTAWQIIGQDHRALARELADAGLVVITAPIWLPLWPLAEMIAWWQQRRKRS